MVDINLLKLPISASKCMPIPWVFVIDFDTADELDFGRNSRWLVRLRLDRLVLRDRSSTLCDGRPLFYRPVPLLPTNQLPSANRWLVDLGSLFGTMVSYHRLLDDIFKLVRALPLMEEWDFDEL